MMSGEQFILTISEDIKDNLHVLSFTGFEAINTDFTFEVNVVSSNLRLPINPLVNRSVSLRLDHNIAPIRGIVHTAQRGYIGFDFAFYKVIITSRLSHLRKRVNHRAYRNLSSIEIIKKILAEYGIFEGIHTDFRFKNEYPKYAYTVQYGQTDYDFIHYLAESEGFFYYFEHGLEHSKIIFSDANPYFITHKSPIRYTADVGLNAEQSIINQFDIAVSSATTDVTLRSYNPQTSKTPQGIVNAYGYTNPNSLNQGVQDYDLEYYQYPSRHFDEARAKQLAEMEIERLRTNQIQAQAKGNVSTLHAGMYIQLEDHMAEESKQPWLIKEIRHIGKQPAVLQEFGFSNAQHVAPLNQIGRYVDYPLSEELQQPWPEFEQGYQNQAILTPKTTPYRPLKLHAKPKVYGTQTAVVTGPSNEEIYCDEFGRVKIQCHWDRDGQFDENSSDWVRVRTGWAHNGYGAVAIPRIGMEVAIEYEEGDPDFPMVTGMLYNKRNKQPYELPEHKTKTVFKTSSSKEGKGANEIHIEDKAGQERIFVQAQKDYEQITKNNHTLVVKKNAHLDVEEEYSEVVSKNRYTKNEAEEHHITEQDRKTEIKGNDHRTVSMAEHTKIGTNASIEAGKEISLKAKDLVINAGSSITLSAGGHQLLIDASGIKFLKGTKIGVPAIPLAAQQKTAAVEEVAAPLVSTTPYTQDAHQAKISFKDEKQQPYANTPYAALFPDGTLYKGITDEQGNTASFYSQTPQAIKAQLLIDNESTAPAEPQNYAIRFQITDDDTDEPLVNRAYCAYFPDGTTSDEYTDEEGYTRTFYTPEPQEIKIELLEEYEVVTQGNEVKQGNNTLRFRVIDEDGLTCSNTPYIAYVQGVEISRGVSDSDGLIEIFYTQEEQEIIVKVDA